MTIFVLAVIAFALINAGALVYIIRELRNLRRLREPGKAQREAGIKGGGHG